MAQITYRANITAAEFPLLSEFQGRSVIVPSVDQNFSRQASSTRDKDRDIGIPQVYYGHNVTPTDAGMESIGYQQVVSAPSDTDSTFSEVFTLRDSSDNEAKFAITSTGRCYVQLAGTSLWIRTADVAPLSVNHFVTTAYANGVTYIYFGGNICKKYNWSTNALDTVTLTGLTAANVLGICAANGYLIAWTTTAVTWSSIVDPTDFTPSLVTGAGGGNVREIAGNITVCLPSATGFTVYTKKNAVQAAYTGNGQYPFAFEEIKNSGGLSSLSLAAYDGNSISQFAYTTSGLQQITGKQAQTIFGHVTDFLAGSQFEDFNTSTYQFTVTDLGSPMQKKVVLVANRYLVISYGMNSLTHALVYDITLERWGKLKVDHVDCFEYIAPNPGIVETPRRSIGFLQADGTVKLVVMSYNTTGSSGVLVLGKYQLDRNMYTALLETHLENIKAGASLTVVILTSIDGKNPTVVIPTLAVNSGLYRRYNSRTTGLNHSLVFIGAFHLSSLVLEFSPEGMVR